MIDENMIPNIPEGVKVYPHVIKDNDLKREHKIEQISYIILAEINGKISIRELLNKLCDTYKWNRDEVKDEILSFLYELNQNHLLNFKTPIHLQLRFIYLRLFLFLNTLPMYQQRISIQTTPVQMFGKIFSAILKKYVVLFVVLTLFIQIIVSLFDPVGVIAGINIFLFLSLSFTLHEFSHAYFYVKLSETASYPILSSSFSRLSIIYPSINIKKDAIVAFSGPLIPSIVGMFIFGGYLVVWNFVTGVNFALGVALSSIFIIHGIFLLPFFKDGKSLSKYYLVNKFRRDVA
ncbi:PqqD family peptide modification chaperone [Bacillus timonensis]|nr:PqqD family peptide modification chaperone [Bacillus timonensis]